jgi:5'-nucleotidase
VRLPRLTAATAAIAAVLLASAAPTSTQTPAAVVTVAHINDVHEIDATDAGARGGLARIATVLEDLRRSSRAMIVTLGGDFLSPSAIGIARLDGEPLAGRHAVAVLNLLGVEWATLGNHEFDVAETAFRARLDEARFRIVSSNVTDATGAPFHGIPISAIHRVSVGGRTISIGFLGLTIDFNRRPWVRYAEPIEAARRAVLELRGKTDAIVALTHQSLSADQALVAAVPDIDLVLGGHEHENWLLRRGPRFTPIVKADANGKSLAVVTLAFGASGDVPAIDVQMRAMDARVVKHRRVQAEIDRWLEIGFEAFRREGFDPTAVVATVKEPLDGRETTVRNRPGNLTDLITAAMAREGGTAIAILNGGSIRVDDILGPGPLTEYDVIRIVPFGGKVLRVTMDGALLESVLDAGLQNEGAGGYLHWRGISRENNAWLVGGTPLDPAAPYMVALPEFLLTGGENRLKFLTRDHLQVRKVEELRDIRQALITELRSRALATLLRSPLSADIRRRERAR